MRIRCTHPYLARNIAVAPDIDVAGDTGSPRRHDQGPRSERRRLSRVKRSNAPGHIQHVRRRRARTQPQSSRCKNGRRHGPPHEDLYRLGRGRIQSRRSVRGLRYRITGRDGPGTPCTSTPFVPERLIHHVHGGSTGPRRRHESRAQTRVVATDVERIGIVFAPPDECARLDEGVCPQKCISSDRRAPRHGQRQVPRQGRIAIDGRPPRLVCGMGNHLATRHPHVAQDVGRPAHDQGGLGRIRHRQTLHIELLNAGIRHHRLNSTKYPRNVGRFEYDDSHKCIGRTGIFTRNHKGSRRRRTVNPKSTGIRQVLGIQQGPTHAVSGPNHDP